MGAPGYYTAYLEFEDGTPATIAYNGYGYFMASELLPWEKEGGATSIERRTEVRKALRDGTWNEQQAKDDGRFGGAAGTPQGIPTGGNPARYLSDLGALIVTCERGVLRQSPIGIYVYNDEGVREEPLTAADGGGPSDPTLAEAYAGIIKGEPIFHDGHWGMATLEVQLALMESARERHEVMLSHQVAVPANH